MDAAGGAVDRDAGAGLDPRRGVGHAHDRGDAVLAGHDGTVRVGPAHLHHQRARREEQRGPARVGGRRDQDLAGLEPRTDRVEDDARRCRDRAGRGRGADQRAVVRDVGAGERLGLGAVVAREYGIPAVVGVPDATSRIETGARVTVDGAAGRVHLD